MAQDRRRSAERAAARGSRKLPPREGRAEVTYIKSNLCRVIHVDGGHGGITAQGAIHLGLYVDRTITPTTSTYTFDAEKKLAREEPDKRPPGGWTREIEADLIMSRDTALAIRNWLDVRLRQLADMEDSGKVFTTAPEDSGASA